ncbi:hypothetical protein ACFWIZ_32510, partial [Streptomyces sp. NPDC127044]
SGPGGVRGQAQVTPVPRQPHLPLQPPLRPLYVLVHATPTGCHPLLPPRKGSGPAPTAPSYERAEPLPSDQ